jgi:SAM-dependent methyltransferase
MVTRAAMGVDRPLVAVMDAHSLGFGDDSFDAAACNFALTYFADPRQALAECRRTLRRRGRFGLVVHDGWWWHDDPRWAWHAGLLEQFGNSYATAGRRFSDTRAVLAIVEQAGFIDAVATVEPFDLTWPDAKHWWEWCWSHGYRAVLEQFDAATLADFQAACFRHLPTGPIEGTLPVMCVVASKPD